MMKCRKRALLSLIFAGLFLIFKLLILLTQRENPINTYILNHPDLQIVDASLQTTKTGSKSTWGTVRARSRVSKDILDEAKYNASSVPDPKEGRIHVLIVPHSHTDPGRLQTVLDYYNNKVKDILDLAVSKLTSRTDMTFIWSETIFLHMWWKEADTNKRSMLTKLVHAGRFEIVAGGWVMPDQAVTHYKALFVQLQIAHEWLAKEIEVSPKVAWSIAPFGHSPTLPYLWSKIGYKFAVTQRVSQKYRSVMASRRQLEFTWRQHWDKAGKADLFCHVPPFKLYNIEQACGPDPSVCLLLDFKAMPVDLTQEIHKGGTQSVIDSLISAVAHQLRKKAANFNHNVVLLPLGDDFRYDTELEWDKMYAILDIVITYINNSPKFNMMMKYGTLSDYLSEVKKQYNISSSPIFTGDFLPYTDNGNDYWTGFYSSRPEQKRAFRELQESYHAASVWDSLSPLSNSRQSRDEMEHVAWTLSLMQHHEAITGTAKASVVGDYRSRARDNRDLARTVICNSVKKIIKSKSDQQYNNEEEIWKFYEFSWDRPQLLTFSSRTTWYIVFVNSLTQPRHEVMTIVLDTSDVVVTNNFGSRVAAQVNPFKESDQIVSSHVYVLQIPVFIESMSIAIYTISRTATNTTRRPQTSIAVRNNRLNAIPVHVFNLIEIRDDLRLSNTHIAAVFSPVNGSLMYVYLKDSDTKIAVRSKLLVYNSSRKSGAYIFDPVGDAYDIFSSSPGIFTASGELSQQIEVTYTGVTLTYTLYNTEGPNAKVIHVTCRVNVNIAEMSDLELIVRFVTDIDSHGILYTDNNGFQHTRRKYRRDTPIAGNYYPMTTDAVIQDSSARFTVHASHAHGVASLRNGELEIMLDRRPTGDEGKGSDQGIQYSNAHVDMFTLQFENCNTGNSRRMCNSDEMFLPTLDSVLINDYLQSPVVTIHSNSQYHLKTFKLLSEKLPIDITIVTMNKKRISSDQLSLRLVLHRRGSVESALGNVRDHPVNLWSLIGDMYILYVRETSLTFLETKRALQLGEKVYLEPMTMAAFEVGLMAV